MNKQISITSVTFFFFCLLINGYSQEFDSTFTINQMRLPVLKAQNAKPSDSSLEDQAAIILSEAVRKLWLSDVIVGIEIDSKGDTDENFLTRERIINFRLPSPFSEAIVISNVELSQKVLPTLDENEYFQLDGTVKDLLDSDDDKGEIHTELFLTAWLIDIKTQEVIAPFEIDVFYTGGSRQKSLSKAMSQLKKKAVYELKWFYWLAAGITQREGNFRELPIGTKRRIRKNELFEIIEPDRSIDTEDGELIIIGGPVALAAVVDTAKERSRLRILRQWQDDYPGSWAVEYPKMVHALQFVYTPPVTQSYTRYGIQFNGRPLRSLDWGFGAQIIKVVDSFDDNDYGFGFGGFGLYRFFNMTKLDLGAKIGFDLDIPFREDDDEQLVSTALLSTHVGVVAEFLISAKCDLVLMAGYRFGLKSSEWSYSEEDESYDAYWDDVAPEVDNSGFTISVGTRLLLK